MVVTSSAGIDYSCEYIVPNQDGDYHVAATALNNSIVLIVNGDIGTPTVLPDNFTFFGSYSTLNSSNAGFMSHFAIYNRALTFDEITSHATAMKTNWDYRGVCNSDGAEFYTMSSDHLRMAMQEVITSNSWGAGTKQNVTIDDDGFLTLPAQDALIVYNAGVVATPTYSSGKLLLGTTKYAVKDDAAAALSSTGAAVVGTFTSGSAPGTKKVIFTIYNQGLNKYWSWYLNSSNAVKLDVVTNYQDGTNTTTTYTYDTGVSNGSLMYAAWIEPGRVKFHSGGTSTVTNQVSGNDWVAEDIAIDKSTILILGADGNYDGPSMDDVDNLYLWNSLPASFSGDYNDLATATGAACWYDFASQLVARTAGTWTYNFSVAYDGNYYGHAVDYDGDENSGLVLSFSYNGSGYTNLTSRNGPIPNFPTTGDLGNTQANGPFSMKATLTSTATGQRPRLEAVRIRVFADQNYKSDTTDQPFVSQTHGTAFSDHYNDPSFGKMLPSALFLAADRLEFPSETYKTIEFVYISGATNGEILCARENSGGTERNVARSGDTLAWTGFDAVYLNGTSVSSGAAVTRYRVNHVICTYGAGISSKINFGAHYDGTLNPLGSGLFAVATYDRVLTSVEIAEHYNAAHGIISLLSDQHDTIALTETTEPLPYSYAWQMTGAPL